ncbi:ABA hypersensitive germination 2 [Hyphodiscus hymeniophilus]|uniref:ABA hypersensitive germination 2 n=1 Tax=Hyphodiscus hymeniophilus TaxID=353542 RepID=A0A9P7AVU1_9HELO|nr:ABA hypersensitive germination 2 [Hyphodiscus hymeniophilus]
MEVPQSEYWKNLLSILEHIANAKLVAIDLEMSGISMRSRFGPNPKTHDNGKPSLQALYDETRTAAETYQILQVGITCVEEDRDKEFYLVRPFNFNMTPLLYLENRIKDRFPERKIVFSSSAADFLQNQAGFDIGKVFREGVYYLSYADEEETRERFRDRMERENSKNDAIIPPSDKSALEFTRYARKIISEWVNAEKQESNFVNVGDPKNGDLNGYQRMLVHQLVQSEFPGHRSFARGNQSFIQVEKFNPKKEAQFQAKKSNEFNDAVAYQIGNISPFQPLVKLTDMYPGLRWIFEALAGGDFDGFRTNLLANEYADDPGLRQGAIDKKFEKVKIKLQKKEHVLVGHNLFTDLVYIYKAFVGPLPVNVEDFQSRIHDLFPIVFDTKYIVTEGHNSMSTVMRKNLDELVTPFVKEHTTRFMLHEKHTAYGSSLAKKHEAGYDSYMTSHLFVKLSASLFAERQLTENFDMNEDGGLDQGTPYLSAKSSRYITAEDDSSNASDDGGAMLSPHTSNGDLLGIPKTSSNGKSPAQLSEVNLQASVKRTNSNRTASKDANLPSQWHADAMQRLNVNDSNPYAVLASGGDDDGDGATGTTIEHSQKWIPEMDSRFWDIYVNKLRVNASQGGVCDLMEHLD